MKRLLSALLSSVMLICMMLPTTAFAIEAEPLAVTETTRIAITVADQNNKLLSDVGFSLYRWDGLFIAQLTTGINGKAESADLPADTGYYLEEIAPPVGYQRQPDIIRVPQTSVIASATTEVSIRYTPTVYGKVKVTAKDDTGTVLSGVTFGVYQNDTLIEEIVTGYDGTAMSNNLTTGEYDLLERNAINGYIPDTTHYRFTVSESATVIPMNIVKQRIFGSLWVKKTDGVNPLSGVTFGIYQNNKKIAELKTGKDGTATSDTLYFGDYELRELKTIDGYELMETPIPFSITTHGEIVRKTVTASMSFGMVEVTVTGEDDERLSGVVFDVYDADTGEKVSTITTAWNGTVSEDLPLGRYYLKQTKTNTGYVLPKNNVSFTVKSSGQTVYLTVTNQKKPPLTGFLRIIKKSESTGALLSGATFGIFDYSTGAKVKELTTSKDGTATFELNEGSYYMLEIKAPTDFELNKEKVRFPIGGGEVTEIISKGKSLMPETTPTPTPTPAPTPTPSTPTPSNPSNGGQTNPSANGTLQIYVHGEQSGSKLSGASFTVHKANGEKVTDIRTNSGGTATLSLSAGDYYLMQTRAAVGFMRETVKIPFIIKTSVTTVVDVTNMKSDMPVIEIPKTGEEYPFMNYTWSVLLMGLAVMCGIVLYRKRKTA